MLKALREIGCPWDGRVTEAATSNNDMEMLKWVRSQKCSLQNVTSWTITLKNNEMFFWAIRNGCKLNKEDSFYAAEVGNLLFKSLLVSIFT